MLSASVTSIFTLLCQVEHTAMMQASMEQLIYAIYLCWIAYLALNRESRKNNNASRDTKTAMSMPTGQQHLRQVNGR